ncbi:MAG: hypothetical protein ACP5I1_11595, partial [Candidatus Hinthialibacter sp.]
AYALAFCTKLHAVFLPGPLLAWVGIMLFSHRRNRDYWMRAVQAAAWAMFFLPVFYIGLQPWLWHDTFTRIANRFFHYAAKTPIPVYYLGTIYGQSNPWHYPFVMVLYTVPAVILLFILAGLASPLDWKRSTPGARCMSWLLGPKGIYPFLVFHFLAPLLIIQLAKAYDGCRLFLPCFPFAACLAGWGFYQIEKALSQRLNKKIVQAGLFLLLLIPSIAAYAKIRPYYLAYYNEIAGGVNGAWKRGMETTFWCDALTRDFLDQVNRIVPEGKTIKPASMSFEVYEYYHQRGWAHPPISDPADYYLLQSRQGMWRRDETRLFFHETPLATVEIDGVQLFGLYKTPD